MVLNMSESEIMDGLMNGKVKLGVIGLGQVGLRLALYFAEAGCSVVGYDIDVSKVDLIKRGICPLNTDSTVEMFKRVVSRGEKLQVTSDIDQAVDASQVHFFCLPTPLSADKVPDLTPIVRTSEAVGKKLKRGSVIILESSVYPGVCNKVVKPILEKASGLKGGEDFGLAYCFERVDPGNNVHRIDNTPKVVGATDARSATVASTVYSTVVKAPITRVRNCETAELVKLVENIYRDVNIAYANEIALLCSRIGVDVLEVLEAASTKWTFTPHMPGAGVGGACIPINPYYLMKASQDVGLSLRLIQRAREVNESMPRHTVQLAKEALGRAGKSLTKAKICVLGIAYKGDVDDRRGSVGEEIAFELQKLGAKVVCYDPVITSASPGIILENSLDKAVEDADCIIIASEHTTFKSLNLPHVSKLANMSLVIVDGKNVLVPKEVTDMGIAYIGIGRSEDSERSAWNVKFSSCDIRNEAGETWKASRD